MLVAIKKWFKQTKELGTDLAEKLSTSSLSARAVYTL
jgi:hypothetical protein